MFISREVKIGNQVVGGAHPTLIQSMISSDLEDIDLCFKQIQALHENECELVRLAITNQNQLPLLQQLRAKLAKANIQIPIVADVHNHANLANALTGMVEKVRINPGNYLGNAKKDWTDATFHDELAKIETALVELINHCKKHTTALRIGVNHGSIADRILYRYGNTAEGLVASIMEFTRICKKEQFDQVVLSIKSSQPEIMIKSNRLLVCALAQENMNFPIHLGVTEAGSDLEGRVRSMIGIGTLLNEGIGDTIRVSLTENPLHEIPVALAIKRMANTQKVSYHLPDIPRNFPGYAIGKNLQCDDPMVFLSHVDHPSIHSMKGIHGLNKKKWTNEKIDSANVLHLISAQLSKNEKSQLKSNSKFLVVVNENILSQWSQNHIDFYAKFPVILKLNSNIKQENDWIMDVILKTSESLINNRIDGLWLTSDVFSNAKCLGLSHQILQETGRMVSKTSYVSCPGCGRTQFDLEKVNALIKEKTSHFKGLRIGIMGCVINGIGEMGNVDYGYVGAGKGKINLYKAQTLIQKNIPENLAIDALLSLINEHNNTSSSEIEYHEQFDT